MTPCALSPVDIVIQKTIGDKSQTTGTDTLRVALRIPGDGSRSLFLMAMTSFRYKTQAPKFATAKNSMAINLVEVMADSGHSLDVVKSMVYRGLGSKCSNVFVGSVSC